MSEQPKMTPHTQTVLRALLGRGTNAERRKAVLTDGVYGLELTRISGLPNGTLFPVLERLVQCGWAERYWERDESAEAQGRPRRRYYRITSKGAELAPHALAVAAAETSSAKLRTAGALRPGTVGGSQ